MDVVKKLENGGELKVALHRDLAEKVLEAERSLIELATEMGISVEALRRWSAAVERSQDTPPDPDETLVPSSRVRSLEREIEELKALLGRQAVQIQVLKKKSK